MKKNRSLSSFIKLPIYSLFFVFIAWSAYWFLGTIYIENKVLENNNLKYKKSSISGYPVFFDINLKKLEYNNVYENNRPGSQISTSYNILDIIDNGAFIKKILLQKILNCSKLFLIFLLQNKLCLTDLVINLLSFKDSIAHN